MSFDSDNHRLVLNEKQINEIISPAVKFFMTTPKHAISELPMFQGVGVYAIYLDPTSETIYKDTLSEDYPIYVGKAVPSGSRQGRSAETNRQLRSRLMEHKRSIDHGGLPVTAFKCRFMIMSGVAEDLISVVESALVRFYHPLWNSYIDGFGIHTPGKGRFNQQPSEWDTLHPGRPFLKHMTGEKRDKELIIHKIHNYKMNKF